MERSFPKFDNFVALQKGILRPLYSKDLSIFYIEQANATKRSGLEIITYVLKVNTASDPHQFAMTHRFGVLKLWIWGTIREDGIEHSVVDYTIGTGKIQAVICLIGPWIAILLNMYKFTSLLHIIIIGTFILALYYMPMTLVISYLKASVLECLESIIKSSSIAQGN